MSKKLIRPTDIEDAQISAAALADQDNPPLSATDTLLLTPLDFEAFAVSIENPPKPTAVLHRLMARH